MDRAVPQNIYDDPSFFAGYRELRETDSGLNGVLEQPAFLEVLPDLRGRRILDLGSGFGDFAREARLRGAAQVIGVEISTRMITAARERTTDPGIDYVQSSIEDYRPDSGAFDLVTSSLALHYVENYVGVLAGVFSGLRAGGVLVFSVEHPICTAKPSDWLLSESGDPLCWPVDDYSAEGARETHWFVDGVIKYHRTCATYLNGLLETGFSIRRVEEPQPAPDTLAARPELALQSRRPPFLLIAAARG